MPDVVWGGSEMLNHRVVVQSLEVGGHVARPGRVAQTGLDGPAQDRAVIPVRGNGNLASGRRGPRSGRRGTRERDRDSGSDESSRDKALEHV